MSLLVVGSVAFDSVQTPTGKKESLLGGSATHFAYSAAFFTPVRLVAVVGKDFPHAFRRVFLEKPIDLNGLSIKEGKTFRWKGKYGYDLNRRKTIYTRLNVFSHFSPHLTKDYQRSKFIFLANIDPELQVDILNQIKNPTLIALDTMKHWMEDKRRKLLVTLKRVNLLILNDEEARELSGEINLMRAAKRMLRMGPEIIIIKKGEHGALLVSNKMLFSAPAYPLDSPIDPTGAGDTFAGGVMGYLARCKKVTSVRLRQAVIYGSIMASFNVEDFSLNRLRRLKREEIETRYREFKEMVHF